MTKSFLLFLMLLLVSRSQQVNAQEQAVSIRADKLSLPQVLKELEEKTKYTFFYSNDIVTNDLQVSIDAQQRPLSDILKSILETHQLFYSFRDQRLILIGSKRMQDATLTYSASPLYGVVTADNNTPIAFATVVLFKNGRILTDMACKEDGTFALDFPFQPDSAYELKVSSVGFQTRTIRFVYPDRTNISSIKLHRQTGTLKEVNVKGSKPMIERQIDRLVFNLSNSIAVQGTDVTEALRLTPMVKVTENGLSLIGKGEVGVLINGRMVHLSGASLMSYLRSLRSEDIERIEVITVPPARYEAQGAGGLINIVLKKNPRLGWSGNLNPTYSQNSYPGYGMNANLNYQSNRISSSLKVRYLKIHSIIREQNDIVGASSLLNSSARKSNFTMSGANLNFNYRLSKNADIGFIYDIGPSETKAALDLVSTYRSGTITDSILSTTSEIENKVSTQTLNLYYDQKLDSNGKKLSTTFTIFNNTPESKNAFTTLSDHATDADRIQTYSKVQFNIWSAQSDLLLPYKKVMIETGAKFTHFTNNADVQYYDYVAPALLLDPSKSNLFNYTETNTAGYISAFKQLDKKWGAKAGLRYEYATTEGFSPTTGQASNTAYGKLFPTAYISYKPDGKHSLSLAYSKRINRPYLRMVNPFRFYANPHWYFTGNPLLQPSISHNLELSWLYKGIVSLVAYGSRLHNGYGDLTFKENGYIFTTPANYLTQYTGGLIATLNLKLYPWWENSSYAQYSISDGRSSIARVTVEPGSSFNYSTSNSFKLNKTFSTFVNYSQSLPSRQNNQYTYGRYELSFGLRARLLKDQLQVGVSYFKGALVRYRIQYKDMTQSIATNYDYRTLRLTATYSFGRKNVRGANKNIQFNEKQRAN
jgi:hypothetical protein